MDETIAPVEKNESMNKPQEVKFGTVVRTPSDGPDDTFVIMVVHGPNGVERAYIRSDQEGQEKIGLPGTYSGKLMVIGQWPIEKIRRGVLDLYGVDEATASPEDLQKVEARIAESSSQPSVMYQGLDSSL